jgi:single-strand DNA-binding protein
VSAVNSVVLSGRLVRDPELKVADTGTQIFNNAIAVESYDPKAEDNRRVSFINFVVFGNFAEQILARKLKKGDYLTIQGELRQRTWETDGGEKRSAVEVIARQAVGDFQFRKAGENGSPEASASADAAEQAAPSEQEPPEEAEAAASVETGDDIPF